MNFKALHDSARPYIACYVILRKGDKIAMVLRKNTGWMDGFYGLPAGKGEYNETYRQGAAREALEEAGVTIQVKDLSFAHVAHRHSAENDGYTEWVDVYFNAKAWHGEPHNAEPHKSERLDWLDLNNLPENIVLPQRAALIAIASGKFYSEFGWS